MEWGAASRRAFCITQARARESLMLALESETCNFDRASFSRERAESTVETFFLLGEEYAPYVGCVRAMDNRSHSQIQVGLSDCGEREIC